MEFTDFDEIIDRRESDSTKWDKYRGSDILPMWVADSDFMAAPAIIDALQQRVSHGVFGYSSTPAQLDELLVARMQQLYNWQIEPAWLVWLPSLVSGLHLSCRTVGQPGDTVISPRPIYPPFMSSPGLSSRQLLCVPMRAEKGREILDFDAMETVVTPDCRLLLFCNPHNPGGACYRRQELEQVAQFAARHDLVVCSDEIHCDLILEPGLKHVPLGSLDADIQARTITLMAPNKTFNIAGLGSAFAIIPDPTLRRAFSQTRRGIVPDVGLLAYTAALAAYRDGDSWNQRQLEYLRGNRDYLVQEINTIPGLRLASAEATYLAWIDVSAAQLSNPAAFFEQAGVGMSAGRDFGDERYMRLNFGCSRSLLKEAVRRIRAAMEHHMAA